MANEKQVLVCLLDHKRALLIKEKNVSATELKVRVEQLFADVLGKQVGEFFLQLKDESWGEWVDLIDQTIPDRAVLRANFIPAQEPEVCL